MIARFQRYKHIVIFALVIAAGLCIILPPTMTAKAESTNITRYAYKYTSGADTVYDLLGLYRVTDVQSDSEAYISSDGNNFTRTQLPAVARYVKSASDCVIFAEKLPTAKAEAASVNKVCYENQGVEKICDGRDNNYMATTSNDAFRIDIALDDFYELIGFRWYAYLSFYPAGTISVSLNGTDYVKWADLDFSDKFVADPYLQNAQGYLMTEYSAVKCKYIRVETFGEKKVATREVTFYGEKFSPEDEDPEGIEIRQKNSFGAYNTEETALVAGDTFELSASYLNPASVCKIIWKSEEPNMLRVDEYGTVTVLRGGSKKYYSVTAKVTSPNGTVYTDEIKIYVKSVINLASMADLSWKGADFFYGAPAKAFDGIKDTWGNWMQVTDGTAEYSVILNFSQAIKFGKIAVYLGVNAPQSISLKGIDEGGDSEDITVFEEPSTDSVLVIEEPMTYCGFVFVIKEKSAPSTIKEIEIFNHEDFSLGDIKEIEVPVERGPHSQMEYIPQRNDEDLSYAGEYDKKYSDKPAAEIFEYTRFNPVYIAVIALGTVTVGASAIALYLKFGGAKKEKRKNDEV